MLKLSFTAPRGAEEISTLVVDDPIMVSILLVTVSLDLFSSRLRSLASFGEKTRGVPLIQ